MDNGEIAETRSVSGDSRIGRLVEESVARLPFEPLAGQYKLLTALSGFVCSAGVNEVFVLNGYAGTGKTSVMGAFIRALDAQKRRVSLVAPTGRAAKVAESFSGHFASTIHKLIFRGNSLDPGNTQFFIAKNTTPDMLFVVDEASLIGDDTRQPARSLLVQLVRYVYSCPGCKMILVGDKAQLPPVGQERSTAMDPDRLKALGLDPVQFSLDIPVRQAAMSGIVYNATYVRQMLFCPTKDAAPRIFARDFPDVEVISSADLADRLAASWGEVGSDETLIVTRSNKRANSFNRAIRNMVMYAEEPLERGDRVIVAKNDYYWGRVNDLKGFIANGESAEVTWVGRTEKAYGRYFTDVELRFGGEDRVVGAKVVLRSLVSDGPSLPRDEMQAFYNRVLDAHEGSASQKIKGALEDPYYNALQLKYAYCVTCHKAQGGQWKHVYIDMGAIMPDGIGPEFYRWLYTAMTRATERLFIINPTIPVE